MVSARTIAVLSLVALVFKCSFAVADDDPVDFKEPEDQTAIAGSLVSLVCSINKTVENCQWFRRGELVPDDGSVPGYLFSPSMDEGDCSLNITSSEATRDSGRWMCIVTPEGLTKTLYSNEANVEVKGLFTEQPADFSGVNGQEVALDCKIEGPASKCSWIRGNEEIDFSKNDGYQFLEDLPNGNCSLVILSLDSTRDSGRWMCQVTLGSTSTIYSRQATIKGGVATSFKDEPRDSNAKIGAKNVRLYCAIRAPASNCSWVKSPGTSNKQEFFLGHMPIGYSLEAKLDQGQCNLVIEKFDLTQDLEGWMCTVTVRDSGEKLYSRQGTIAGRGIPYATLVVDSYDEAKMETKSDSYVLLRPGAKSAVVEMKIVDSYPKFTKDKHLFLEVDDKRVTDAEFVITDDTTRGTEVASVKYQVNSTKTTKLTIVYRDTSEADAENKPFKSSTVYVLSAETLRLDATSITQRVGETNAKVSVLAALTSEIGGTKFQWETQKEDGTWEDVSSRGTSIAITPPSTNVGLAKYKATVIQPKYFDFEVKTEEVTVFTYVPMTNVSVTSATEVTTKIPNQVDLVCTADGDPAPEIRWTKATDKGLEKIGDGATLHVGRSVSQSGRYKCGAVQKILGQTALMNAPQVVRVTVTD